MPTNAKLLRLTAFALLAGGLYYYLARPDVAPPAQAAPADPNYFAFVRSMDGTRPDGDIRQGSADQLVVDAELAHLFDYYLSGLGKKPLEAIRVEIARALDQRLRPTAATQAKRLLDNYIGYKRALVDVERKLPPTTDMARGARQRLGAMQQLRQAWFSETEIAGLFGDSDAYDGDAIERLDIAADATLTPDQRKDKLAALDRKLPPAMREDRDAPTRVLRLEEQVAQLRSKGAGDNGIYRLRATALSPEAAARLADLDREEGEWQRRITAYQAQRRALAADGTADAAALQQLRDAGFSAAEQKRLGAYE